MKRKNIKELKDSIKGKNQEINRLRKLLIKNKEEFNNHRIFHHEKVNELEDQIFLLETKLKKKKKKIETFNTLLHFLKPRVK